MDSYSPEIECTRHGIPKGLLYSVIVILLCACCFLCFRLKAYHDQVIELSQSLETEKQLTNRYRDLFSESIQTEEQETGMTIDEWIAKYSEVTP